MYTCSLTAKDIAFREQEMDFLVVDRYMISFLQAGSSASFPLHPGPKHISPLILAWDE